MLTGAKRTPSGVGTWQSRHSSCWPKPYCAPSRRPICATPPVALRWSACGKRKLLISRGLRSSETRCVRGVSPSQRTSTDGWNCGWAVSKFEASPSLVSGRRPRRSLWQSAQNCWRVGTISCAPSCSVWQSTQRPGSWPKKPAIEAWMRRQPPRSGSRRLHPRLIGMVVNLGVAGGAGGVAHRFERLGVAGGAILLQRGVTARQRAAAPQPIGMIAGRDRLRIGAALLVISVDRPGQEERPAPTAASDQDKVRLPGNVVCSAKRRVSNLSSSAVSSALAISIAISSEPISVARMRSTNGPTLTVPPVAVSIWPPCVVLPSISTVSPASAEMPTWLDEICSSVA